MNTRSNLFRLFVLGFILVASTTFAEPAEVPPEVWMKIRPQLQAADGPVAVDSVLESMEKKLTAFDGAANDYFGDAVSVAGDVAIVGADGDDSAKGAAYIFERNAGGTNAWGLVQKLTAADGGAGDYFGEVVSIAGDVALVSSYRQWSRTGAVYVFERNAGGTNAWGLVKKLTAADGVAGDSFGIGVSVAGDVAIVGATGDDSNQGAAYVFERNAGGTNAWGQVRKVTASDGAGGDQFGAAVSVAGNVAVVCSRAADSSQGSAYMFERNAGGTNAWGQSKKLTASDGVASFAQFGYSASIEDGLVLIGAMNRNSGTGAAYLFEGVMDVLPEMLVLGTNGAGIASDEVADDTKGTAFGSIPAGSAVTNLFSITNSSGIMLTISGVSTNGPGASSFRVVGLPATVAADAKSDFNVVFNPSVGGAYTAAVQIANDSATTPYIVNLTGTGSSGIQNQTITFPALSSQRPNSKVGLAATASSSLPVSFTVGHGPAVIAGGTNLSFTATGLVSIVASQAGDESWNPAPNVTNSFSVLPYSAFSLRAVALRTNVVLRWTDPYSVGFSNQTVLLRFSTVSYPAATNNGTEIFRNTNQVYTHTGLTPGQPYYYTVWCSHDGVTFVPPPYDEPPTVTNGPVTVFWFSTLGETAYWHLDTNGVLNESGTVQETPVDPAAWIFGGVADINKDNRPEIFWSPTNAVMKTWFLDENYQYSSNATLYGSQCPREYQFRCSGDASGDGFPDLFYQDVYFGYIDSWHVRPNGTLLIAQPTYASSINRSLQLRDCGDVNGDGRVELFFQNTNDGTTATWFMDTNGQQTAMLTMYTNVVSNGWTMVCAGDVSGDGNSEIFWQHTNGTASIWFLNTNGFRTNGYPMTSTPVADGWRMVDKADVNGDGRVELLWQNTDGSTMVWFLNPDGTFARQQEMSSTPMPSKWRMMGAFTAQTIVTGPP